LVHLDLARGLLWVIVVDGRVEVEAGGQRVEVGRGQQVWVFQGRPPEQPRPATRAEVGDLFPPIEELTNGLLPDVELLEPIEDRPVPVTEPPAEPPPVTEPPAEPPPVTEPPAEPPPEEELVLTLEQSTDEVFAGECGDPRTVQIVATLSGGDEAIADVAWATLRYRWDSTEDILEMERVDDRTFVAEINPADYCCSQTTIFYTVDVYDRFEENVASGSGELLLTYRIC
jgi:hypothetical protein